MHRQELETAAAALAASTTSTTAVEQPGGNLRVRKRESSTGLAAAEKLVGWHSPLYGDISKLLDPFFKECLSARIVEASSFNQLWILSTHTYTRAHTRSKTRLELMI